MKEDKDLIASFYDARTRHDAFNLLVNKYQQRVYKHIRKMVIDHDDANDLTQEVFIKVWKGLLQFRGESGIFTWIYRIASNECLQFLSKKRRMFFLPLVDVEKQLINKLKTIESLDGDAIQLQLQEAILTLPPKQRLVFHMKYYEDMKYEEISEILGTSVGGLKASYHLAVSKIENFMTNQLQ